MQFYMLVRLILQAHYWLSDIGMKLLTLPHCHWQIKKIIESGMQWINNAHNFTMKKKADLIEMTPIHLEKASITTRNIDVNQVHHMIHCIGNPLESPSIPSCRHT